MIIFIIIIGIVILVGALGIYTVKINNQIVLYSVKVEEAFSTMDVYLKKRYDLIPNLVEIVKGYAKYEKETLENIIRQRNIAINSSNNKEIIESNNQLSNGLHKIFALTESYPDLKANQSFLDLQKQLIGIEDDIANSRKYYNGSVRNYNHYISTFPNSLIAKSLNKSVEPFYSFDSQTKDIEIKF